MEQQDEQNRLLAEQALEEELQRHAQPTVGSTGRWSFQHALQIAGLSNSANGTLLCSDPGHELDRAVGTTTRPVHWELDYQLGSKVGGGAMGGRRECLPRWESGSKPLHEWSAYREQRPQEEVRLSASAHARDGGSTVGRWPVTEYVGAQMQMLSKEVAAAAATAGDTSRPKRSVGRQQLTSVPIMPDHYNSEPASAATHRQEHIAVNGRGKKLGPYGPLGGPPVQPPAGDGAGRPPPQRPPNILL